MKKTIAMLSALAISASLVMPFTAVAADAVQVTKVDYDTVKDYTVEQMVAFLNVSANGTAPDSITGADDSATYVLVPYGYDEDGFKVARYENGVHVSGVDSTNDTLGYLINTYAKKGWLYMLGTSGNTITQDSDPKSANTNVKYSIDPAYTITIPAAVELDDKDVQATFKVEGAAESGKSPLLHKDDKIVVKLTRAENNPDGANFYVTTPNRKGKATYHVKNAENTQIELGGTIATFEYQPDKNTDYWTKKATFTKPEGATYAGVYTDTLTFNISVENPNTSGDSGTGTHEPDPEPNPDPEP